MPRKKSRQQDPEVPDHLFQHPESSVRNVRSLHELFLTSGSTFGLSEFRTVFLKALEESPDPDLMATNFLRFAEASASKAAIFNDLLRYPPLMDIAVSLFGSSRYFADILVRDPELFRWLTASGVLNSPYEAEQFSLETDRVLSTFQESERRLNALRRLYRREILRIGTRDMVVRAEVSSVTEELSLLADSLIRAGLSIALDEMKRNVGAVPDTPLVVIGLGKLGGGELNYSSDIDVIFVYKDDGELYPPRGKEISFHEFFVRLAEKVIQHLSESSQEGHLYRVDTRLRPEGGVGSLARSMAGCMTYYESRGDLWERQMLIKARPVAGDLAFGHEFIRLLNPFVYPRTHFTHPAASVARIKARIESELSPGENIKLMAGGIRDIEFTVQTLQLLHGGNDPSVREPNTTAAIRRLQGNGLLSADDARTLLTAYDFYRTVEHRLQIMQNTQTHTIPPPGAERTALARRLGFRSSAAMDSEVRTRLKSVRKIFEEVLGTETGPTAEGIRLLLTTERDDETVGVMSRYGFRDVRKAVRNMRLLLTGSALGRGAKPNPRVTEALGDLADTMLDEISHTPVPDLTLQNFSLLAAGQSFPEQFYNQLNEPGFRMLVMRIAERSPRLIKGLLRYPPVLDAVAANLPFSVERASGEAEAEFKNRCELHAGVLNLMGVLSFDQFTSALTSLADVLVRNSAEPLLAEIRDAGISLALFALGKYGTEELSYDGDLDILFLSESSKGGSREKAERAAQEIVGKLQCVGEGGRLYEVDARLRPEGKNAPLVTDLDAYRKYLRGRSSLWERQSLTRLRYICGSDDLGDAARTLVEQHVYETPLPADWVARTVSMRKSMETRSRTGRSRLIDIKLGPGGMVDLEFMAQMIQLQFGRSEKRLRGKRTADVLRSAPGTALPQGIGAVLAEHYGTFRKIEKLIHVTLEDRGTTLPSGEKLETLALCSGRRSGKDLLSHLTSRMQEVRKEFLVFAKRLKKGGI